MVYDVQKNNSLCMQSAAISGMYPENIILSTEIQTCANGLLNNIFSLQVESRLDNDITGKLHTLSRSFSSNYGKYAKYLYLNKLMCITGFIGDIISLDHILANVHPSATKPFRTAPRVGKQRHVFLLQRTPPPPLKRNGQIDRPSQTTEFTNTQNITESNC